MQVPRHIKRVLWLVASITLLAATTPNNLLAQTTQSQTIVRPNETYHMLSLFFPFALVNGYATFSVSYTNNTGNQLNASIEWVTSFLDNGTITVNNGVYTITSNDDHAVTNYNGTTNKTLAPGQVLTVTDSISVPLPPATSAPHYVGAYNAAAMTGYKVNGGAWVIPVTNKAWAVLP